jgi:hypothetical protein
MAKRKDNFGSGWIKGTFDCPYCGHHTRETNETFGLGMCPLCWEEAGIENAYQDENITEEEYTEQMADLKRRYELRKKKK